MVYLISNLAQAKQNLHQAISCSEGGQCCAKCSVHGMAVRKVSLLFANFLSSWDQGSGKPNDKFWQLPNGPLRAGFA